MKKISEQTPSEQFVMIPVMYAIAVLKIVIAIPIAITGFCNKTIKYFE